MNAKVVSEPVANEKPKEDADDLKGLAPEDAIAVAYGQLRECDSEQRLWLLALTKCADSIAIRTDNDPEASEYDRAAACRAVYRRIARICASDLPAIKGDRFGA
jgi:hypothetical protein